MLCILRQMGLEISGLTTNFSPVAPQEVIDIKIKEVSEKSTKKEISTITPPQELNQNDFVVPILDQSLSAGKGQLLPDDDNPIGYIAVPKELKRYGNKLAAIYVNGDSMEPTLQRGDLVVCDSCGWDGDGIYALRMDGCGYVKRLARKPGKLVVISDNPKYETWEEPTESEAVSIIGRVHYTLKHVD
ncbi:S24 family peptidase [Treponema sp.]|uniref:S24 family peptidase n=1 Tax=Treponema sp. TaxID=166 RepID=UPI00298D8930|nr:S24 family peptidase [Treponema sp.]